MQGIEAIALTDFVHGDITALEGRIVRHRDGTRIRAALAADLERAGLVRIRTTAPITKPATVEQGKARDDGKGRPSSSLQADPASTITTSNASVVGAKRVRKIVTSSRST